MATVSTRAGTPAAFVQSIVERYISLGLPFESALRAANIPVSVLSEPSGRVTAMQFEALSYHAMQELDDEALGWFERPLPWGTYGMLARASLSAPTLRVAIKRWCRHHSLLTKDVQLVLTEHPDQRCCIELREHGAWSPPSASTREFCHVSMFRNLLGLSSWLIDSKITLICAEFAFDKPKHIEAYTYLFPCDTTFGQSRSRIFIENSYLNLSLRRDEAAMQRMLSRALPLTVHTYRRDRLLVERVQNVITSSRSECQSAEDVAAALNISVRTLQRQLGECGTTFLKLKSDIQIRSAKDFLLRTNRSIKQIAHSVGYQNDKSFIRAFGRATGFTPEQFRALSK